MRSYVGALSRLSSLVGRPPFALVVGVTVAPLFAAWALLLDQRLDLPVMLQPEVGAVLLGAGLALVLTGTAGLWLRTVSRWASANPHRPGIYRIIAHPVSVGFVFIAIGLSLRAGSPAGFWVVSPVVACLMSALAFGYPRRLRSEIASGDGPLIRLPRDEDARPGLRDLISVVLIVLVPWAVLFQAVEILGAPTDAWSSVTALDRRLPVIPWTESIYAFTYPFAMLAPLVAGRNRDLRRFSTRALLAIAIIIPFYLLLPVVAPAKPVPGTGFWQSLMELERRYDRPITAFPAFHVVWSFLAASLYAVTFPRLKWLAWALAAAISVTCVTTGMHAVPDIVAGLLVFLVVARAGELGDRIRVWAGELAGALQRTTNGRSDFAVSGMVAGLAAGGGFIIAAALVGPATSPWLAATLAAGLLGAAVQRHITFGRSEQRDFECHAGELGGFILGATIGSFFSHEPWTLFAAALVATGVADLLGSTPWRLMVWHESDGRGSSPDSAAPSARLRHAAIAAGDPHVAYAASPKQLEAAVTGGVASAALGSGEVVRAPERTAVDERPFAGRPFALLGILVAAAAATRLWFLGMPVTFIAGAFLMLSGLGRLAERKLRHPSSPEMTGFEPGQWSAMARAVAGVIITTIPSQMAPGFAGLTVSSLLPALAVAALAALVGRPAR